MAKIKLDLKDKSYAQKVEMGRKVGEAMGNPAPSPYTAKAATLKAATDDLEAKNLAADTAEVAATNATRALHTSDAAFDLAYGALGGQAQTETGGDPTALTTLGYALRATGSPTTSLDFVPNFSVTTTNLPSTLDFAWDAEKGAVNFELRGSKPTDPAGTYSFSKMTTKTRMRADGFVSGVEYSFQICAHGPGEIVSPWSDPFSKMAS